MYRIRSIVPRRADIRSAGARLAPRQRAGHRAPYTGTARAEAARLRRVPARRAGGGARGCRGGGASPARGGGAARRARPRRPRRAGRPPGPPPPRPPPPPAPVAPRPRAPPPHALAALPPSSVVVLL